MPHVTEEFYNALQEALICFRDAKQYKDGTLHEVYQLEIDIMRQAIGGKNQSDRQLRESVQKARKEINNWWRNCIVSSLLCDYVKNILKRYPLDTLYEKQYFKHEEMNVKLMAKNRLLTLENETLKKAGDAEFVSNLYNELQAEKSLREQLDKTLATSLAHTDELHKEVAMLRAQADKREASQAALVKKYEEVSKKYAVANLKLPSTPTRQSTLSLTKVTPSKKGDGGQEMESYHRTFSMV